MSKWRGGNPLTDPGVLGFKPIAEKACEPVPTIKLPSAREMIHTIAAWMEAVDDNERRMFLILLSAAVNRSEEEPKRI